MLDEMTRWPILLLVLPGTLVCSSDRDQAAKIQHEAGTPGPSDGVCGNGLDDNGDGRIDEGCPCYPGERQPCFDGPPSSRNLGACTDGWMQCQGDVGTWGGVCLGAVLPSEEVCNGVDDDCDGTVDEACPCGAPGERRMCGAIGYPLPCRAGEQVCDEKGLWSDCAGHVLPQPESCDDGVDNDCNGLVDEGCDCAPEPEVCGDGFDNDCDGLVDEACEVGEPGGLCDENAPVPCVDGYVCAVVTGDVLGVCRKTCTETTECDGLPCLGEVPPGYCPSDCDPVSQVGCPVPLGCYTAVEEPTIDGTMAAPVACAEKGSSPIGGPCVGGGDCVPATFCVQNVCHGICRVNGSDCPAGETCIKVIPAKIIYGVEYGACN